MWKPRFMCGVMTVNVIKTALGGVLGRQANGLQNAANDDAVERLQPCKMKYKYFGSINSANSMTATSYFSFSWKKRSWMTTKRAETVSKVSFSVMLPSRLTLYPRLTWTRPLTPSLRPCANSPKVRTLGVSGYCRILQSVKI